MLITISGLPGSGKSTVGRLLAKRLHVPFYSIGDMRRAMARERGLTLEEFNALGEKQAFTDRLVDRWQAMHAKKTKRGIFEGRTSFYFIPQSVKIFLAVRPQVAAKRIMHDGNHLRRFEAGQKFQSAITVARAALQRRVVSDVRRYKQYYGLNILLRRHYDLYLDTSRETPEQTARRILGHLKKISTGSLVGRTETKRKKSKKPAKKGS